MALPENRIHDTEIIKLAVIKLGVTLVEEFQFTPNEIQGNSNFAEYCFEKNDLRLIFFISKRDGVDFRLKDLSGKEHGIQSLSVRVFPRRSVERKEFLNNRFDSFKVYDTDSIDHYYYQLKFDIQFLNEHFPEILKSGKLP